MGTNSAALIACRKALYVEIEHRYDVSVFMTDDPVKTRIAGLWNEAPYYARDSSYIEENVAEPTDFIAIDHRSLDQRLMAQGADPTSFWNVWRLTPPVFRTKEGAWIVRDDVSTLLSETERMRDDAEYVLGATIDIILCLHSSRRAVRSAGGVPRPLRSGRRRRRTPGLNCYRPRSPGPIGIRPQRRCGYPRQ